MTALRLNLLSPEKRIYLRRMITFQFIKSVLEILIIAVCIAGISLLGGQWVLENHLNELSEGLLSVRDAYSQTNQDIKKINNALLKTKEIQREYTLWTPLIDDLVKNIPDNIVLANMDMDAKNKIFTITGAVPDRQDLLQFQTNLESIAWVKAARVPLSQLAERKNIQFSLTVELE